MSDQKIQEWNVEPQTDPYDNHADIRRELEAGPPVQSADQVFESVMRPTSQPSATASVLSEAIKRIEQAKLYETLLKHNLFSEGSARPEIIEAVQNEIREFTLNRLEILLGMKPVAVPQSTLSQSPFSDDEIAALRMLASRMIQREAPRETNPQIVQVQSQESSAMPLSAIRPLAQKMVEQAAPSRKHPAPTSPDLPHGPTMHTPTPTRRPRRSQAVNPAAPPVKMPTNDMMNAMNAVQAAKAEQAMGGSALGTAIAISKVKNANEGE